MNSTDNLHVQISGKTKIFMLIAFSIFTIFSLYLFYLQVIKFNEFRNRASSIRLRSEILPAQRGTIFDSSGLIPLVLNIDSFAIQIIPAEIPKKDFDTVFAKLAEILNISVEEFYKKVPPSSFNSYQPIEIARNVKQNTIVKIAERKDEFPGISWYVKPFRNYLETGSFSHILGYVGEISKEEIKLLYNQGYQNGDIIGKAGLEKQYDKELKGKDGRLFYNVDAKGRKIDTSSQTFLPQSGNNLVLTIDYKIQKVAEKALGSRYGSIIVLKPATGEVLAMVSYPYYNANILLESGGNNYYIELLNDKNSPLINRTIQSSYPPASTFKTIASLAILEEKLLSPEEKFLCTGKISYGERVWRCWLREPGHGWLNLKGGFAQSCDIYYWEASKKIGVAQFATYLSTYASELGFGKLTQIDLPGEVTGFVPSQLWKEKRLNEKWSGGDTFNMVIGQGFTLVTPLQLADMLAMVVNEGIIYKPHIVKEIRDGETNAIIKKNLPEIFLKSSISKETFRTMKDYFSAVTTEGTARYALKNKYVKVAGKTGTAEVGLADRWHCWFIGYGPADYKNINDVIIVVAMVEATNPWEWWAPYATNIIFNSVFGGKTYEETLMEIYLPKQNFGIRQE